MINSVDLVFGPIRQKNAIEFAGGSQVLAERLFHNESRPAARPANKAGGQVRGNGAEKRGRGREIEKDIAAGFELAIQHLHVSIEPHVGVRVVKLAGKVMELVDER